LKGFGKLLVILIFHVILSLGKPKNQQLIKLCKNLDHFVRHTPD